MTIYFIVIDDIEVLFMSLIFLSERYSQGLWFMDLYFTLMDESFQDNS